MNNPIIPNKIKNLLEQRRMLPLIEILKTIDEPCLLALDTLSERGSDIVLCVESKIYSSKRRKQILELLGSYSSDVTLVFRSSIAA